MEWRIHSLVRILHSREVEGSYKEAALLGGDGFHIVGLRFSLCSIIIIIIITGESVYNGFGYNGNLRITERTLKTTHLCIYYNGYLYITI